jgi:hypothetical protein
MLTGKQKAQMLISLLGDESQDVLSKLSEESASLLTSSIEDAPKPDPITLNSLISEILEKVSTIKGEGQFDLSHPSAEDLSFDLGSSDTGKENDDDDETEADTDLEEDDGDLTHEKLEEEDDVSLETETDEMPTEDTEVPAEELESELDETVENQDILATFDPNMIAELLIPLPAQIVVFFLSKLDESITEPILNILPKDLKNKIKSKKVDTIPIADTVFDNFKDNIVKTIQQKLAEEEEQRLENENTKPDSEYGTSELSMFGDDSSMGPDLNAMAGDAVESDESMANIDKVETLEEKIIEEEKMGENTSDEEISDSTTANVEEASEIIQSAFSFAETDNSEEKENSEVSEDTKPEPEKTSETNSDSDSDSDSDNNSLLGFI